MVEEVYVKGTETVFINIDKKFVYEVTVYCIAHKYFAMVNTAQYISDIPLPIVRTFTHSAHVVIRCELYSAPMQWLFANDYYRYIKPDKKKRIKKPKIEGNDKPKITVNKQGTWRPDGKTDSS